MLILKAHVSVVVGADYKLQMEVESICLSLTLHCMLKKKKSPMTTQIFLPMYSLRGGMLTGGPAEGKLSKD